MSFARDLVSAQACGTVNPLMAVSNTANAHSDQMANVRGYGPSGAAGVAAASIAAAAGGGVFDSKTGGGGVKDDGLMMQQPRSSSQVQQFMNGGTALIHHPQQQQQQQLMSGGILLQQPSTADMQQQQQQHRAQAAQFNNAFAAGQPQQPQQQAVPQQPNWGNEFERQLNAAGGSVTVSRDAGHSQAGVSTGVSAVAVPHAGACTHAHAGPSCTPSGQGTLGMAAAVVPHAGACAHSHAGPSCTPSGQGTLSTVHSQQQQQQMQQSHHMQRAMLNQHVMMQGMNAMQKKTFMLMQQKQKLGPGFSGGVDMQQMMQKMSLLNGGLLLDDDEDTPATATAAEPATQPQQQHQQQPEEKRPEEQDDEQKASPEQQEDDITDLSTDEWAQQMMGDMPDDYRRLWEEAMAKAAEADDDGFGQQMRPAPAYVLETAADQNVHRNDAVDDVFAKGVALMEAGEIQQAIQAFEAVVTKQDDNADAWRYLGQAQAENEHEQAAISALLKCISLDQYNLPALLTIGVSYTNDLEQVRALNFLKTWLQNNPDYQGIEHSSKADQRQQEIREQQNSEGDMGVFGLSSYIVDDALHKEVLAMFEAAAAMCPTDVDVHVVLGVLHCIKSDYEPAIACFRRAASLRPTDATLWNKLGATLANSQQSGEAIEAYMKALELRPNYVRALANLAIAFANQGQHEDAVKAYLASLSQNPDATHLWGYLRLSLSHLGRADLTELSFAKDVEAFRAHFDFS